MMKIRRFLIVTMLFIGIATGVLADETALQATVAAGQRAEYRFEIRNDSNTPHDYSLTLVDLPSDMQASFTAGGPVVDTVTIDAQSYQAVFLRVDVPFEMAVGRYTATVHVQRDDEQALQVPLTLTVENTYALRISSQNININTFSGQEFQVNVTANNTGASDLNNVSLMVDAPAKWVVQVNPQSIDTLSPDETASFDVTVLVSPAQISIDQQIALVATSDQVSSPETSVQVRVQNNPNYLIYALVIVGLAVVGSVIYFRKQGRR